MPLAAERLPWGTESTEERQRKKHRRFKTFQFGYGDAILERC